MVYDFRSDEARGPASDIDVLLEMNIGCQPKVSDDCIKSALSSHDDVLRFDVAMDETFGMHIP